MAECVYTYKGRTYTESDLKSKLTVDLKPKLSAEYSRLKSILNRMGITLTSLDRYEEVTGRSFEDIDALTDLAARAIAVADGKADIEVLAEESGHIAVAAARGTFEYNVAMREVTGHPIYQEVLDEGYAETYSNDPVLLAEEALGRLVGRRIKKGVAELAGHRRLLRMIDNLITGFLNFFRQGPKRASLDDFVGKYAQAFLDSNISGKDVRGEEILFAKSKAKHKKKTPQEMLDKIVNQLVKKQSEMDDLLRVVHREYGKGSNEFDKVDRIMEKEEAMIAEMHESIRTLDYEGGILFYLNAISGQLESLVKEMNFRNSRGEISKSDVHNIGLFIAYHEPFMVQLREIAREASSAKRGKGKSGKDYFSSQFGLEVYGMIGQGSVLDDVNVLMQRLDDIRKENTYKMVVDNIVDVIASKHGIDKSNPSRAKLEVERILELPAGKTLEDAVQQNENDINWLASAFGLPRYRSDVMIQHVHAMISDMRMESERSTVGFANELADVFKEHGFLEKNTDWMFDVKMVKDDDGKEYPYYTGHFVSEIDYFSYGLALNKQQEHMRTTYDLTDDAQANEVIKEGWEQNDPDKLKSYNKEWRDWFSIHTTPVKDWRAQIAAARADLKAGKLTRFQFDQWMAINTVEDEAGNITPTGMLIEPARGGKRGKIKKADYSSSAWGKLDDNQKELLDKVRKMKTNLDLRLGKPMFSGTIPPQYSDTQLASWWKDRGTLSSKLLDLLDTNLFTRTAKTAVGGKHTKHSRFRQLHLDQFIKRYEDDELYDTTDEELRLRPDKTHRHRRPVVGHNLMGGPNLTEGRRLQETNRISTNILASMIKYHHMVEFAEQLDSRALDLSITEMQAAFREPVGEATQKGKVTTGKETPVFKIIEALILSGGFNMTYDSLTFPLDKWTKDFSSKNIDDVPKWQRPFWRIAKSVEGKELEMGKVATFFGRKTSAIGLAWNPTSVTANFGSMLTEGMIETFISEHMDSKSNSYAMLRLYKEMPLIAKELGDKRKTSKTVQLMQYMGLMGRSTEIFKNSDMEKWKRVANAVSLDAMLGDFQVGYLGYEAAGFVSGALVMYSMMHFNRVDPQTGKLIDYSEMLQNRIAKWSKDHGGERVPIDVIKKLKKSTREEFDALPPIDELITNKDGKLDFTKLPKDTLNVLQARIENMANNLDGKLGPEDSSWLDRQWWSRFIFQHRGYARRGYERAFREKGYVHTTGKMEEGWTRLSSLGYIRDLLGGTWGLNFFANLQANWYNTDPYQRENAARFLLNNARYLAIATLAYVLNYQAMDDEEEDRSDMQQWGWDFTAYLANRLLMEASAFSHFGAVQEITNTIQSPFVPIRFVSQFYDIAEMLGTDPYERGGWKGIPKYQVTMLRMAIPGAANWKKIVDPASSNSWIRNKVHGTMYSMGSVIAPLPGTETSEED